MAPRKALNTTGTKSGADTGAKLVYSIPDVMAATDAGRTTVYRAIQSGELVARKRGRRTIILADDLRRWLNSLKPLKAA
jgi:Helix-turn-helix domain